MCSVVVGTEESNVGHEPALVDVPRVDRQHRLRVERWMIVEDVLSNQSRTGKLGRDALCNGGHGEEERLLGGEVGAEEALAQFLVAAAQDVGG